MAFGINHFEVWDYLILLATILGSILIGLYYGYMNKHTNEELLMGGRNMSVLPVAASVLVTYLSGTTLLGIPSEVYANGAQVFMIQIMGVIFIPVSALLFIPFFYEMRLTSVHEYLERRFESRLIRSFATVIFMVQQVLVLGIILYAPSLVLETFLGLPTWMSIVGMGLCATLYTNVGGLKAVVWTDAFQFVIMAMGMATIVWRGFGASGGPVKAFKVAADRGRMNLFDFTFDPFSRHNFWNFLLGSGFGALMQPGTHQLQVQRYSGMPTAKKGQQAVVTSVLLKVFLMGLIFLTGFALLAFYADCDPFSRGEIKKLDQIVPYFVVQELTDIPGMLGLFTACIFSGALSSLSSSLNSLSAVTWEDFLVRYEFFKRMSPRAQTNVTRLVGVIFGLLFIAMAFSAKNLGSIYVACIKVTGATGGTLYAAFIMALFLPFVNRLGAIVGMVTGFGVVASMNIASFIYKANKSTMLPMSTDGCGSEIFNTTITTAATPALPEYDPLSEWPLKILNLSYLLYPFVTALISVTIGVIVSCVTDLLTPGHKRKPKTGHIHPLARGVFKSHITPDPGEDELKVALAVLNGNENGKKHNAQMKEQKIYEGESQPLRE